MSDLDALAHQVIDNEDWLLARDERALTAENALTRLKAEVRELELELLRLSRSENFSGLQDHRDA